MSSMRSSGMRHRFGGGFGGGTFWSLELLVCGVLAVFCLGLRRRVTVMIACDAD